MEPGSRWYVVQTQVNAEAKRSPTSGGKGSPRIFPVT